MKVHELLNKFSSYNGVERGDFAKIIAELTDGEFEKFAEEIKKLVAFKDTTCGLFAMDSDPNQLLYKFWQRSSDACPLESTSAEKEETEFAEFVDELAFKIEY